MTDQVQVLIGGQIEGLTAALAAAQEQLEGFAAPITSVAGAFSGLAEAAVAAFAVDKIAAFIDHMAELGAQVQHASQMLGISAEQVSAFQFAAKAMGLGAEGANTALERLERNMSQAATEPGLAANAFDALGIKVTDASGHLRQLDDILPEIAQRFHETADGPAKTAIAIALMGRSGAEMIPLLDQGRAGLDSFRQAAQDTGTVITGPMAEGMERTSIGITTLGSAFQGVGITLFEAFKPAIDVVVKGLTDLVEGFNNSLKSGGAMNTVLGALVVSVDILVAVIEHVINVLRGMWDVGQTVLHNLTAGFTTLGTVMGDVATGQFSRVTADFTAGWNKMVEVSAQGADQIKAIAEREVSDLKQLFSNVSLAFSPSAFGGLATSIFGVDTSGGGTSGPAAQLPGLPAISSSSAGSQQQSMMQQWRDALQQRLVDEQNFFKSSQADELAYWQSKLATAEQYESEYGLTLKEAQQLHLQVQTQIYNLEKEQSQEWLQSYMAGLNEQLAGLKDELAEKKISEQEWYQQSIALEQNRQAVLKQLQLDGTAAYADSLKNMEALDRQHVQASEQSWNSIFTFIDNNLDQMLTGVLRGTQTWQQAMTRVFDNLATSFIEDVAKMMVKWAAFEALGVGSNPFSGMANTLSGLFSGGGNAGNQATQQLTAAITGQTAATVQNTGGIFNQIASGLQWIAQTLGLTAASATQTAATTASAATTTGGLIPALVALTAAVIANTAAQGMSAGAGLIGGMTQAAALGGGIIALDTGAWSIPQDMIALVHQGEAVLPRDVATQMRAGQPMPFLAGAASAAGASPAPIVNVALNVSAIDGNSVASFFKNNSDVMTQVIARAVRNASANLTQAARPL